MPYETPVHHLHNIAATAAAAFAKSMQACVKPSLVTVFVYDAAAVRETRSNMNVVRKGIICLMPLLL